MNFLTGKTLLVFCYGGVSGQEAHIWGSSVHRSPAVRDSCLLSEVMSLNHWPQTGWENKQYFLASFHTAMAPSKCILINKVRLSKPERCFPSPRGKTCILCDKGKRNKLSLKSGDESARLHSVLCLLHGWRIQSFLRPARCVYFFIGHLYSNTRKTVGILDLGGGSTQITFLPKSKVNEIFNVVNWKCPHQRSNTKHLLCVQQKTIQSAPSSYIAKFNLFNHTYQLYTHR